MRVHHGGRAVDDVPVAERKARLRAALLRHLRNYPLAGDTAEGIVACWVPAADRGDAPQFIGEVIDAMVAAGELMPLDLPGGRVLYVRGPAPGPGA
jgi:hypothetical protein